MSLTPDGPISLRFLFTHTAPTEIYTLSLHDALPILGTEGKLGGQAEVQGVAGTWKDLTDSVNSMASNLTSQVPATPRSEEHTSELQSHSDLVCRLLLEKKKGMYQCMVTRLNTERVKL